MAPGTWIKAEPAGGSLPAELPLDRSARSGVQSQLEVGRKPLSNPDFQNYLCMLKLGLISWLTSLMFELQFGKKEVTHLPNLLPRIFTSKPLFQMSSEGFQDCACK